jgi:rhodanese-related sulfurtransferase
MAQEISPQSLQKLMASAELHAVLDVRPGDDYRAGQIFRSTTVPLGELRDRLAALVPVKSVTTVLLHADEESSKASTSTAEAMGYTDVRWLEGGYEGWTGAGLPVINGWSVVGKDHGERLLVQEPVPEIEANELAAKLKRGDNVVVLDSRTPAEFSRACIPGGRSVPGGELPLEITDILAKQKKEGATVVINCAGRTRSILGAFQLQRMGIPNVVALRNGTMGWQLAGHQLETGTQAQRPARYSPEAIEVAERAALEIAKQDGVELINVADLQKLQANATQSPLYVVDVRLTREFVVGHIPGALTIPGGQLPFSDDQIAVRGARIVTVCDGRARSIFAASLWAQMGWRASALDGGVGAWTSAGLPLESGGMDRPFGGGTRTPKQMVAYLAWEERLGDKWKP